MLGITLDSAKTFAAIGAVLLLIAAFVAAWMMKTLLQKVLVFVLFVALAFAVWTQRSSLQDCADLLQDSIQQRTQVLDVADDECSIFGVSVSVPPPSVP